MGVVPPKSKRFCTVCEKETTWSYDRAIGHSRCCMCGGQYGSDPDSYFTTVFKQKCKAEKEVRTIEKNYIKLLEIFLKNEEQFSKKLRKEIKEMYNPALKKVEVLIDGGE